MSHSLALEAKPKASDMNAIMQGLLAFNTARTGGGPPEYLVVTLRDDKDAVVGGLVGATWLGWLHVHAVWLPETLRGHRYGTEMMAIAEKEAARRGCAKAFLETLSFQALAFYEKCGYVVHSRLADFPVGGARYALTKTLAAAE